MAYYGGYDEGILILYGGSILCDGAPGVEQLSCNVGSSTARSYSPTNDEWRSLCGVEYGNYGALRFIRLSGMRRLRLRLSCTLQDNGVILPFRADNCCCRLFHNGLVLISTRYLRRTILLVRSIILLYQRVLQRFLVIRMSMNVNCRYDRDTDDVEFFGLAGSYRTSSATSVMVKFPEFVGGRFSSPQQQVLQVQFEYEWTIEFSGRYIAFRGTDTSAVVKNTKRSCV